MFDYRPYLARALEELDAWRDKSPGPYSDEFYLSVERLLRSMVDCSGDDLDRRAHDLLHVIMDSGPLDADFVPSFKTLVDALDRLRLRTRAGE
jgi:hypothetical protein